MNFPSELQPSWRLGPGLRAAPVLLIVFIDEVAEKGRLVVGQARIRDVQVLADALADRRPATAEFSIRRAPLETVDHGFASDAGV